MRLLLKAFTAVEDGAGPLCLALLMAVLTLQVAGRALGFGLALTWTDEAARTLFVWSVFLSLPLASKRGAMVRIRLSARLWPGRLAGAMPRVGAWLWTATAAAISALTFINVRHHGDFPFFTPILGLNQNHLFMVIPVAFLMIALRGLCDLAGRRP